MATSAQSGSWDSGATWGGSTPLAGETVTIANGHTVSTASNDATEYGDVTINAGGVLVSQHKLLMAGKLTVAGTLHQKSGSVLEFTGNDNAYHGVFIENVTTAHHIAEGSDGMTCNQLNGALAVGSSSLTLDSTTGFNVGDWIAVFDNKSDLTDTSANPTEDEYFQDEGMWVHAVIGTKIYFRDFVGPDDVTISSVSTGDSTITVSNSKGFRVGQTIVFGGYPDAANINTCRISGIDYTTHIMTLMNEADTNAYTIDNTPSLVSHKVYRSGTKKPHKDNSKVRICANIVQAERAATDTTLAVAHVGKYAAGDTIVIEIAEQYDAGNTSISKINDRLYKGTSNTSYDARHVIASVSGTAPCTITLESAIGYIVPAGSLITRLTRDIIIGSLPSASGDEANIVDSTNISYYYAEHYSGDYNRTLILKDVYFRNVGNNNSNFYGGFVIRGYYSSDDSPVTISIDHQSGPSTPYIEGCAVMINGNGRRDYSGMWSYDARNTSFRCCTVTNGEDAFTLHYEPSQRIYNCFAIMNRDRSLRIQGVHYNWEIGYVYCNRTNVRTIYYEPVYNPGRGFHNIISKVCTNGPVRINRHLGFSGSAWNWDMQDNLYQSPYLGEVGQGRFTLLDSRFTGLEDANGTIRASSSSYAGRHGYSTGLTVWSIAEADFEYDKVVHYIYYGKLTWVESEGAYLFQRTNHDDYEQAGPKEWVYIPANTTARIRISCKGTSNFSGEMPKAFISSGHNQLGQTTGTDTSGPFDGDEWNTRMTFSIDQTPFTSSGFTEEYQNIDFTIAAVPYSQFIEAGVFSRRTDNSNTSGEGIYVQPIEVFLDTPYVHRDMRLLNTTDTGPIPVQYGTSHDGNVRRLGGTR